jgi:hypothetical protein
MAANRCEGAAEIHCLQKNERFNRTPDGDNVNDGHEGTAEIVAHDNRIAEVRREICGQSVYAGLVDAVRTVQDYHCAHRDEKEAHGPYNLKSDQNKK